MSKAAATNCASNDASLRQRWLALLWACLWFVLCYEGAAWWALQQPQLTNVSSFLWPVVPWMVWPYLSSPLLLLLLFVWPQPMARLRLTLRRFVLITAAASCCFVVWPLTLTRPQIAPTELHWWVQQLDPAVNLSPSLHVAYACLGWLQLRRVFQRVWQRLALGSWLLLLAASTLFTGQHVWPDLLAGAVLTLVVAVVVDEKRWPQVTYYSAAALLLLAGFRIVGHWFLLYLACSCLLVAWHHAKQQAHFLHKQQGRHPVWVWLLYAPYLSLYWLTWRLVCWRERAMPPCRQILPHVWVGRRLASHEVALLPAELEIIDLSGELAETAGLQGRVYQHWPLPDLVLASSEQMAPILAAIQRRLHAGASVYIHCAMGYQRSQQIAAQLGSEP